MLNFKVIPSLKPLHLSCGVHDALLSSEEGMALATDLNFEHWLGRAHGECIATGADDLSFGIIFRVNLVLH
jgi:hypothetical protein